MLSLSHDSAGSMLVSNLIYISNHKTNALECTEHQATMLPKRVRSTKVLLRLSFESAGHMLSYNLRWQIMEANFAKMPSRKMNINVF